MAFEGVIQALRGQAEFCRGSGSPFTGAVCDAAAADVQAQGPITPLVAAWRDAEVMRAVDDAAPLRLAAAFHHARLSGAAPELEAVYPPAGLDLARLSAALKRTTDALRPALTAFMASPPQTNEVMRCYGLLPGFLRVAAETGLPLTCLEIGASAGLNLNWSRFRYEGESEGGPWAWGDPASPVRLVGEWRGPAPVMADVGEVEAWGCDVAPVDVRDPAQALRLQAYVWADQPERMARLTAAMAVARETGRAPERADAGAWLATHLHPRPGRATVLYHSIMRQYLSTESAAAVDGAIAHAAARATVDAPVAWLVFEPDWRTGMRQTEVRLTIWPGGEERRLALSHPHGAWVEALA